MTRYSIEQRTGKYLKGHSFFSFGRNLSDIYVNINLILLQKQDALKTVSKKEVYKEAETTREFIANKTAEKMSNKNLRDVEESLNDSTVSKFVTRK